MHLSYVNQTSELPPLLARSSSLTQLALSWLIKSAKWKPSNPPPLLSLLSLCNWNSFPLHSVSEGEKKYNIEDKVGLTAPLWVAKKNSVRFSRNSLNVGVGLQMLENCHPLKQPTPQCRPPPIPHFSFASELWIVSSQTNAWMHTRTRHTCRHHYIQTTGPPYIQSQTVYMCLDEMCILFTLFLPYHSQIHVRIYTQVHKYTVYPSACLHKCKHTQSTWTTNAWTLCFSITEPGSRTVQH